jgi:hypothetical protein
LCRLLEAGHDDAVDAASHVALDDPIVTVEQAHKRGHAREARRARHVLHRLDAGAALLAVD